MTPLNILLLANGIVDLTLKLALELRNLPEAGTPEEQAKMAEVKGRLDQKAVLIQGLLDDLKADG